MPRVVRVLLFAVCLFTDGRAHAVSAGAAVFLPVTSVWYTNPELGTSGWFNSFETAAVGSDGLDFLVVWNEAELLLPGHDVLPDVTIPYGTHALRVSAAGQVVDPDPIVLSRTGLAGPFGIGYSVAADAYLVAGRCGEAACAVRVSSAGAVLDPAPLLLGTPAGIEPRVLDGGGSFLVFAGRALVRVGADGALLDPGPIAVPSAEVAFDGTSFLAVWAGSTDPDAGIVGILGQRFTAAGAPVDPAPRILVADARPYLGPAVPRVAFDGGRYVVVWESEWNLVGVLVGLDGAAVAGSERTLVERIGGPPGVPRLTSDGLFDLSVWSTCTVCDPGGSTARGTTFRSGSGVLVPGSPFSLGEVGLAALDLASNAQGNTITLLDGPVWIPDRWHYEPACRIVTTWAAVSVATAGAGGGTVASTPAGLDCGSACMGQFPVPSTLTLTATPDGGSAFRGWSGACEGVDPTCVLPVSATASVTATFEPSEYALSVSLGGWGRGLVTSTPVGIACATGGSSGCTARFANGAAVTLRARPRFGSVFVGWSGAGAAGCKADPSCSVTMDAARSLTASFRWAFLAGH